MNKPKDTPIQSEKCHRCKQLLHPGITEESCEHFGGHYPGCHNVHLGCANMAIDRARFIIKYESLCKCGDEDDRIDPTWEPCEKCKWLQQYGEE